jgi:hypothetical protein
MNVHHNYPEALNVHQESQIDESLLARAREIERLAGAMIAELQRPGSRCGFATKRDLDQLENKVMSKISEFGERDTAWKERLKTAITGINTRIGKLKEQILALQNNPGPISIEDQAILDKAEVGIGEATTEAEAIASILDDAPEVPA